MWPRVKHQQIAEREENGIKIRVMAPDPRLAKEPKPMAARDDSRRPWQNYRRREIETGRW